jgi:hypothetical protein
MRFDGFDRLHLSDARPAPRCPEIEINHLSGVVAEADFLAFGGTQRKRKRGFAAGEGLFFGVPFFDFGQKRTGRVGVN